MNPLLPREVHGTVLVAAMQEKYMRNIISSIWQIPAAGKE